MKKTKQKKSSRPKGSATCAAPAAHYMATG